MMAAKMSKAAVAMVTVEAKGRVTATATATARVMVTVMVTAMVKVTVTGMASAKEIAMVFGGNSNGDSVGRHMHECESTGTLGYWYSGRRMHECEGTGTLGYWYSFPTLTYFEVDLWSARWHPNS
jgi:hypothetical protein